MTTLCAPPTVWRMLVQEDLTAYAVGLREVVGAGEPLNPEVIEQVRAAWGLTIRDGYGQTETTLQVGNFPGEDVRVGAMGRPAPGYAVALLDVDGHAADEGEVCLDLARAAARADDGLPRRPRAHGRRHARRPLPHGRRRPARRRRLPDLRRPHGRRLQGRRLPHLAVRARERADRARGGRRGGRRREPRSPARRRAQGVRAARRRPRAGRGAGPLASSSTAAAASRPTSASAASSSPTCRRRSAARSAASSCARPRRRARPARRATPRNGGRRT